MNFMSGGYRTLGQLQPAADLMRKAIATDPLRPGFHASLASVLLAQGQLDAAEQSIRKGLDLQPDTRSVCVPGRDRYPARRCRRRDA